MIELKDYPDRQTIERFKARFPVLDTHALESWLAILQVASALESMLNEFLSVRSLQQSRFFILILLVRNPDGLNLSMLAEKIGISKPTMTGIVNRMERDGLVTKSGRPVSKRETIVLLTRQGNKLLNDVLPEHYTRVAEIMHILSAHDHANLRKILKKIRI